MFGVGAFYHTIAPSWLSPFARDLLVGGAAALTKTVILYPLDTVKTRAQMQTTLIPSRIGDLYHGLLPASVRSSAGMGIWLSSRNILERSLPDVPFVPKHFLCGALSSMLVDL
jgi:hypothetical protein